MSDRLEDLRRRRDLLRDELASLDREIAARQAADSAIPEVRPSPGPQPASDPEAILEEFRLPQASIARRARLGCLIYFAVAMALLALAIAAVYLRARAAPGR